MYSKERRDHKEKGLVWFLVFNATFNNISLLIVAVSFIG
jgi:hypothetical protein